MTRREDGSYRHDWRTPIVVKVFGVDEHWYYSPHYNPRLLPATLVNAALAMPPERISFYSKYHVVLPVIMGGYR